MYIYIYIEVDKRFMEMVDIDGNYTLVHKKGRSTLTNC